MEAPEAVVTVTMTVVTIIVYQCVTYVTCHKM